MPAESGSTEIAAKLQTRCGDDELTALHAARIDGFLLEEMAPGGRSPWSARFAIRSSGRS